MAQHLNGRTDGQHRGPTRRRTLEAGMLQQMPGGQPLGVILGAAEGVEVQGVRNRLRQGDLDDLGGNSPQPQTLLQHDGVAAVAVGAHHVGQHQADPHRPGHR